MTRDEAIAAADAVPGFMSTEELGWLHDHARGTVVEVGAFLGRATVALGLGVRAHGGELHVVDLWSDDFEPRKRPPGTSAREAFDRHMAAHGLAPVLHATESRQAAAALAPGSVDLFFIDADHSRLEEHVAAWRPAMRPGGIMAGHNYGEGEAPKAIVDRLFPERGVCERIWYARV